MFCPRCSLLPPLPRRSRCPDPVAVARTSPRLRDLVCERCGEAREAPGAGERLLATLLRLDRVGLGGSGVPLLRPAGSRP